MRRFLTILIFSFCVYNANAHTVYGGDITYKHISNTTYEITVTTIQNSSEGIVVHSTIPIDWGDGTSGEITLTSETIVDNKKMCK